MYYFKLYHAYYIFAFDSNDNPFSSRPGNYTTVWLVGMKTFLIFNFITRLDFQTILLLSY